MAVTIPFDAPASVQIAEARRQRVMPPKGFYRLSAEKRALAFTVSGLARLDQVQAAADALARHIAEGGTLASFQAWAKTQDWSLPRHRLETIYRNATQTAYNAGHWRRFEETKATRPFLMYDAINDSRVRPSHLALDGVIRPVGDAFWATHSPPLGHRCRCRLVSLSAEQARARGGVTQQPPAEGAADAGWGAKPAGWGLTLGRLVRERLAVCDAQHAFARGKLKGQAIQCIPAATQALMRALAAEHQASPLPPPKPAPAGEIIEPQRFKQDELFDLFVERFERRRATWMDITGIDLQADRGLFLKQNGSWKIGKNERARYVLLMADALMDPATVQLIERDHALPELAVLGAYRVRGREIFVKLAYRWTGQAWDGWSAFAPDAKQWAGYVSEGVPIWRRR